MPYEYIPEDVTAALRGDYNLGLFLHVGTDPALRVAFGYSSIPIGIESVDPDGAVYTAVGQLQDVPELEVLLNGIADEVSFTLGGLRPEHTAHILADAPPVIGAPVYLGMSPLDERWQPKSRIVALWTGIGDYIVEEQPPQKDLGAPLVRSITLVTQGGEMARSKQSLLTYTNEAQKRISADDRFCERTPRYFQSQTIPWPRY